MNARRIAVIAALAVTLASCGGKGKKKDGPGYGTSTAVESLAK